MGGGFAKTKQKRLANEGCYITSARISTLGECYTSEEKNKDLDAWDRPAARVP